MVDFEDGDDFGAEDPEGPDVGDRDLDVEDDTEPCPYCGALIYEDAEFCPHCGKYISEEDAPIRRPVWIVLAVVACLIVVLLWLGQRR